MTKATLSFNKIGKIITFTNHAKDRMKERTSKKRIRQIRVDIIKSIDRHRVRRDRYSGSWIVEGGYSTYILSESLVLKTILTKKNRRTSYGVSWLPLTEEDKSELLNTMREKIIKYGLAIG